MLRVQDQRSMHRAHPGRFRRFAVQQMQQVRADAVVIGLDFDAFAAAAVVVPVHQHRSKAGQHTVDDLLCHGFAVRIRFLFAGAQHRTTSAHHVHRVRICRNCLKRLLHRLRQTAQ